MIFQIVLKNRTEQGDYVHWIIAPSLEALDNYLEKAQVETNGARPELIPDFGKSDADFEIDQEGNILPEDQWSSKQSLTSFVSSLN